MSINPNKPVNYVSTSPRFVDATRVAMLSAANCSWWNGGWPCTKITEEEDLGLTNLSLAEITPESDPVFTQLLSNFSIAKPPSAGIEANLSSLSLGSGND